MIEIARQPHKAIVERLSTLIVPEISVTGIENLTEAKVLIDQRKPVIFAPNHLSNADAPAFLQALRCAGFPDLATKIIFLQGIKLDRDLVDRWLLPAFNVIKVWPPSLPANTEAEKQERFRILKESLGDAKKALEDGKPLLIFPEAGRSYEEQLKEGAPTIAHFLKLVPGTVVFPVGIIGTEKVLPHDKKIPVRHPISMQVGDPIEMDPLIQDPNRLPKGERNKPVINAIMQQIAKLLPPEYRGVYA